MPVHSELSVEGVGDSQGGIINSTRRRRERGNCTVTVAEATTFIGCIDIVCFGVIKVSLVCYKRAHVCFVSVLGVPFPGV